MKTDIKGIELIKEFEGCKLKPIKKWVFGLLVVVIPKALKKNWSMEYISGCIFTMNKNAVYQ